MYLVPSHQLEQLKAPTPREENIRAAAMYSLDGEMQGVLQRRDLSQDEKAKQYTALLQKYLVHVKQADAEKEKLSLFLPSAPEPGAVAAESPATHTGIFHEILDSLSARFKNKARLLLNKMKQNQSISSWDEKGAFVYRGEPVPGSNMLDLVKGITQLHALPARRIPKGWDLFLQAMAELNVPSTVVGNPTIKDILEHMKNPGPVTELPQVPTPSRRSSRKQRQSNTLSWLSL